MKKKLNSKVGFSPADSRSGGGEVAYSGYFPVKPLILPGPVTEVLSGRNPPPSTNKAAISNSRIDFDIEPLKIGEPIPVVFARRVGNVGGVMIQPKITFCGFSNTESTITTNYHCILSEGKIGPIAVKCVRRGGCRENFNFSQNYNQRAGDWEPGNTATPMQSYNLPDLPTACGGGGLYTRLSTIEFRHTSEDINNWRKGYNVYVMNGLEVTRILDDVYGSSNNIVDLILWARNQTKKIPSFLNDLPSLRHAAKFVDVNGLFCNGEFNNSESLATFLTGILQYFLLRPTKINGRFSLRPMLPTKYNGQIDTGSIKPDFCFDENTIIPGTYSEQSSDASTMASPIFSFMWRQQHDENHFPFVRSTLVGRQDLVIDGIAIPPEQHDMTQFCTSEEHMAKVGAYLEAKRTLCTKTATVRLVPGSHSGRLLEGDIIQIKRRFRLSNGDDFLDNQVWELVSVSEDETLTLSKFPVDSQWRSLLALAVANVSISGLLLAPPELPSCDIPGAASDSSIPPPIFSPNPPPPFGAIPMPGSPPAGGPLGVPLPPRPPGEPDGPPAGSPTGTSSPGAPPTPPSTPPNPPPGIDYCEDGYMFIVASVNAADFSGSGAWGPVQYNLTSRSGVRIERLVMNEQEWNWLYRLHWQGLDNLPNSALVTASEDGTGGPNSGNDVYPVWVTYEEFKCKDGNPPPGPPRKVYIVMPGDTLSKIGNRLGIDWTTLYNNNKDVIGPNPDLIFPGTPIAY